MKFLAERCQLGQLFVDAADVSPAEVVDAATGAPAITRREIEQGANIVERESQVARPPHESQPINIPRIVASVFP